MNRGSPLLSFLKFVSTALPLQPLTFIEKIALRNDSKYSDFICSPIFLIATPRSGSTLTYQCLTHHFKIDYLTNCSHFLYKLPFLGGWLSSQLVNKVNPCSSFASSYGFVPGLLGQAEGLNFWTHWIGAGLNDGCHLKPEQYYMRTKYLVKAISSLQIHSRRPLCSAYLGHSLFLEDLHRLFPNALFVRLTRDPLMNACSLLSSMRKHRQTRFSVVPSECFFEDKNSEHFNAASQVYWLNRRISSSLREIPHFCIAYESLCSSPSTEMMRFADYAGRMSVELPVRHALPSSFRAKNLTSYESLDIKLLEECFEELYVVRGNL